MIWSPSTCYEPEPYEFESDLEAAIIEVAEWLFGPTRVYLDVKRKVGTKGKTASIPDGYLIDLTSHKRPMLYVVENELARHEPLKHIAVQVLQFSLAFEGEPHRVKQILKSTLDNEPTARAKCESYALAHGFENLDYLLEQMIYHAGFSALVVIDEIPEDLESVLISRFRFPVEVLTLARFTDGKGNRLYQFEPFLSGVTPEASEVGSEVDPAVASTPDPSDLDTIVVPAREDGFKRVFIGESRWYQIRIHPSMLPRIKWIAVYVAAPTSAITYVAPVKSIEQWQDSSKYVINFAEPASEIGPIQLVKKGRVKAPQGPRYTTHQRLIGAKNMDEVF